MITILGLFFAVLNSFAASATGIVAQKFKVDPPVLAMYRGLGIAILLFPFLLFIPHPTSYLFYMLVCINGVIAATSFRIAIGVTEEHGANIMSKFLTVPPVIIAVTWWIINPTDFVTFINDTPIKAIGAIFCLIGMTFTIFALGHNKYTHKALISASPLFLCYTAQAFLTFFALKQVNLLQGMFYYVFIQALIVGVINYFVHIHHLKDHIKDKILLTVFDKDVMRAGLIFVLVMIIARMTTNIAFKFLDSPAHVALITNLQILWTYLVSKKMHLTNVISPTKGVILAIYAIMFIMLTM